jgi:hypothetical protein
MALGVSAGHEMRKPKNITIHGPVFVTPNVSAVRTWTSQAPRLRSRNSTSAVPRTTEPRIVMMDGVVESDAGYTLTDY